VPVRLVQGGAFGARQGILGGQGCAVMRRAVLRLLGLGVFMPDARTSGGRGGSQPPSPYGPAAATQAAVTPGVSGIDRARILIISGPSGTVSGVFEYRPGTTPAAGNPPVAWMTNAATDLYGNPLPEPGVGSASWVTDTTAIWSALSGGQVLLAQPGQAVAGGLRATGDAELTVSSGQQTASDTPAGMLLESAAASGIAGGKAELVAGAVQLTSGAADTIPLAALSEFPVSGSATLATTIAAVNALYAALQTADVFA
jgi:hypothetical protein